MTEDTQTTEEAVAQDHFAPGDGIETPEILVPIPPDQAHRGSITTMELKTYDTGTTALILNLLSVENERETEMKVWLPRDWVEDITLGGTNDPNTLPREQGNNQFMSYVRNIYNSNGTATLQVLRGVAAKAGRMLPEGTERPTTLEEYFLQLELLLPGIRFAYALATNKKADPQYRHRLEVVDVADEDKVIGNPKRWKRFDKMWEQEQ